MRRETIDYGIDLGTTNSTVAVVDGIDAKPIPNQVGSVLTPSAVWIDRRNQIRVGAEARQRALVEDPQNADLEFKLRMGMGAGRGKTFERSGRVMQPEELSAEVLKELRNDVRTSLGEDIQAAVVTVPAAFEQPATAATQRAAKLAGFTLTPLLLEPVAASLAYGLQSAKDNVFWLVYDFGGGTFDAAVMRIRDGMIHVESHEGDNFLGGKLLDWDIVTERMIPAAMQQFDLPGLQRGNDRWTVALGKLKYYAERAKIEVCRTRAPQEIYVEQWCKDAQGKEIDFTYVLTPEDVEAVSRPYLERSIDLCRKALKDARLSPTALERILMVGGSTLNPWIRDGVAAEMRGQLEFGIDPVTVVARGASLFASTVANKSIVESAGDSRPAGSWQVNLEYEVAGNIPDPDIGGRITAPDGGSPAGCTIEFIDKATRWRSGRITLGSPGVFVTQIYAATEGRHDYVIEVCDAHGTQLPASRAECQYTYRKVIFRKPPAVSTIGIGLVTGEVAVYIKKGDPLPARKMMDHLSMVLVRAGHEEDALVVPILEGEHTRAARNHGIGELRITGDQLTRDLPVGSQVEITVIMDESQQIKCQAFIGSLERDFDVSVISQSEHGSVESLQKEAEYQKGRLATARDEALRVGAPGADILLARVKNQQLLEQIDHLCAAAASDHDALGQLDRRLKELAALIDALEDAIDWPKLVEQATTSRSDTKKIVVESGTTEDKKKLQTLESDFDKAMASEDAEALRRCQTELDILYVEIRDRQPGWHISYFNYLVTQKPKMEDQARGDQIIAQGRRAIQNNDIEAVKAAIRQLRALLPKGPQDGPDDKNRGTTYTAMAHG